MNNVSQQAIQQGLETLCHGFNWHVAEFGMFPDFTVEVQNTPHTVLFKIGSFEGGFEPEPVADHIGRRYFEILVYTPSQKSHSKCWLYTGSKQEVFQKLQDPQALQHIIAAITQLESSLEQNEYQ